jgi:Lipase (class 3)
MVSPGNMPGMLHMSRFPLCLACQQKHDPLSTAPGILSAVQQTLSAQSASSVTVVGHSLGAALALLDGLFLKLHLPPSVTVKVVGYGMPRVGNQDFANLVDNQLGGLVTHINNGEDPIPIVPGMILGFHHVSGEVHIQGPGAWDACPGACILPISCTLCGCAVTRR